MGLPTDIILDDYYKLRIASKRLSSGRYQVKFFATVQQRKEVYGYLLVESDETLKAVIEKIKKRLKRLDAPTDKHILLHHAGHNRITETNLMIFQ